MWSPIHFHLRGMWVGVWMQYIVCLFVALQQQCWDWNAFTYRWIACISALYTGVSKWQMNRIQMIISTIFTDMDMNTICMTLVAKTVFTYNIVFPRGSWFSSLMLIKRPFVRSASLNSQMFWHLMRKLRSNCCAAELSQIASSFIVWRFFSGMISLRELHLHVDYIHYLFFCTTWVAHHGTCFPWCYLYGTSCLVPVGWIVSPEIQQTSWG